MGKYKSPTALSAYAKCPYNYYISYFKNVKTLKDQYSMLGTSVHLVLEKFWEELKTYNDIDRALQESINKHWDMEIIPEFADVASNIFMNFSKKTKENPDPPLFVEQKIFSAVNDTMCIVDRINYDRIIDYKTSTQFTIRPKMENIIQGVICCLNAKEAYGLDIKGAEFWYLRTGKVQYVNLNRENIETVTDLLKDLNNSIAEENFPKNKNNCGSCYLRVVCEKQDKAIKNVIKRTIDKTQN